MTITNDPSQRDRWARLRFSIIGPLLAAPPGPGELQGALVVLCAKVWRHPLTGLDVRFGVSTLQRWYYAARRASDPVAALKNRLRDDVGRFPSLTAAVIDALTAQYREHPGWTMQLHVDNLRVVLDSTQTALPSYPTIRRYLVAQGMFRQARPQRATAGALAARERLEHLEVRSFEVDHVSALWHLDFHHGSRRVVTAQGQWVKPYLLGVIDDRSRLLCHLQWYLDETTHSLVHGLCQAFMKRGFAMIHGDPGSGKSVALRLLSGRLSRVSDLTVAAIHHPQSNLADFYREMGDIFGVSLRPHNRWAGFKVLREAWLAHLHSTRRRAVLLIDEAQEMSAPVLCELRLLSSAKFDSQSLLCVVIAGDARLIEKLRREELIPLGSRIRTRLATEHASRDELPGCLEHLLAGAGNPGLMTQQLRQTLCDHAAGNFRIMTTLAAELLAAAAQRELPVLDEKLYLEIFAQPVTPSQRRAAPKR